MRMTVLYVGIITSICWAFISISALAEGPNKEVAIIKMEQSYYAGIKDKTKRRFEKLIMDLMEDDIPSISASLKQAMLAETIKKAKTIAYNTAVSEAFCFGSTIGNAKPTETSEDGLIRANSCNKEWGNQMEIFLKITSDYKNFFTQETKSQCELKARLFHRELLFPPYDFLIGNNVHLFDPSIVSQCLLFKVP